MPRRISKEELEELIARYKGAVLSSAEREAMKQKILHTARLHPPRPAGEIKRSFCNLRRAAIPLTAVATLLLVASGTVIAADRARPGDLLFPVDKGIENVRYMFAFSPVKKAEIKLESAQERSEELRYLARYAEDKGKIPQHTPDSEELSAAIEEVGAALREASSAISAAEGARSPKVLKAEPTDALRKELSSYASVNAKELRALEKTVASAELKQRIGDAAKLSEAIGEYSASGGGGIQPLSITIDELRRHPRKYNNKLILAKGIVGIGEGLHAMSDKTITLDSGKVILKKPAVWITGVPGESELEECFYAEGEGSRRIRFCRWEVKGWFSYGGQYGPDGKYEYQIKGGYMGVPFQRRESIQTPAYAKSRNESTGNGGVIQDNVGPEQTEKPPDTIPADTVLPYRTEDDG